LGRRLAQAAAIWLLFGVALLLTACATPNPPPTAQPDYNQAATEVAGTVYAQLTLSAGETAVVRLTEIAAQPQVTAAPPASPTPLPTLPPTPTLPLPSPTPTPLCDAAEFVSDLSIPDNTVLQPGANFTKSWRLKNIGACAWTTAYSLIFVGGDALGAVSIIPLPYQVYPGETVDVSAPLRAPVQAGLYRGNWMLRNASGQLFGVGADAQGVFWVQIQVSGTPVPGRDGYDFAANYCRAAWRNENVPLPCPGAIGDQNGFVSYLSDPELESRTEDEPTLWMRPSSNERGWIIAEFPAYLVKGGDRFLSEVGCLADARRCDVNFYLDYRLSNGSVRNLGAWREVYDGRTTLIDVDLSDLAGITVNFILSVRNNGVFQDADAFWLVPQISNNNFTTTGLALTWQQTGGTEGACDKLQIYLTGSRRGEARAFSCGANGRELGSRRLSEAELSQMLDWVRRLRSYEGEVFVPDQNQPVISFIVFEGSGSQTASAAEINAMQSLAKNLFNAILND
jgi:hypothetical protein